MPTTARTGRPTSLRPAHRARYGPTRAGCASATDTWQPRPAASPEIDTSFRIIPFKFFARVICIPQFYTRITAVSTPKRNPIFQIMLIEVLAVHAYRRSASIIVNIQRSPLANIHCAFLLFCGIVNLSILTSLYRNISFLSHTHSIGTFCSCQEH